MHEDVGVVAVLVDELDALVQIFANGVSILIMGLNNHVEGHVCLLVFDGWNKEEGTCFDGCC